MMTSCCCSPAVLHIAALCRVAERETQFLASLHLDSKVDWKHTLHMQTNQDMQAHCSIA